MHYARAGIRTSASLAVFERLECNSLGDSEAGLPLITSTDVRVRIAGVSLCALCVAYFYLLERIGFSRAHFSLIFWFLLTNYDSRAAWLAMAICLLAILWNRPAPISRLVEFLGEHPHLIALASTALIAAGAIVVYHDYPLSMDEYAAVFQSKIFASGHLFAQLPRGLIDWLVVRGFNGSFIAASTETGRAIECYWPGFALLLAPFEFFRVPWLCNASLAGLAIFLIHWITVQITGERRAGGWAVLFTVASGAFVADALSYYSMQAHLTANLLYVALLLRPNRRRAVAAGLIGSLALILHNPVPHTLFAVPWIVAMATDRDERPFFLPLMLGYLPGVSVGLSWVLFRSDIASGTQGAFAVSGIASGLFAWPDSTLLNMRAAALAKMWLWSVPGVFVFALLGRLRHRDNRFVRLLMQSAVLTFVGYFLVRFDQGHGWGYRYFHSAWAAIPILAGCALTDRAGIRHRLVSFAGAVAVLNLVAVVPYQMHEISEVISQHLAQLPPPLRPGNNVYFIHPRAGFYVEDMVQMDPLLRDRDLLLASRGGELDAQLVLQNWPSAVKIPSPGPVDQWYLGPRDQRVPIPGKPDQKGFAFATDLIPQAPNGTRPTATNLLQSR